VGTVTTLASTVAELGWFTARAGDLILTIAAIHGRPDPTVEERRAWVLAVLLYGSSARDEFARTLNEASVGVTPTVGRQIPVTTLQVANRMMSKMFVRRYGTKRGLVALGRMLPIGLGAAIGGAANYITIRTLARHADQFFARLPYSAIDADSTDVTGRQRNERFDYLLANPPFGVEWKKVADSVRRARVQLGSIFSRVNISQILELEVPLRRRTGSGRCRAARRPPEPTRSGSAHRHPP